MRFAKANLMKPRCSNQDCHALTLAEVLVVIFSFFIVSFVILVALGFLNEIGSKSKSQRINCVNNLKQIGLAYRIWGGDHGDKYPMQISTTNSGAQELALAGDANAIFRGMSNELGTPKILFCPADLGRFSATNFNRDLNGKISYFANVDANDLYPQMILSGDDTFARGGLPVKSGLLEVSAQNPIAWTAARHKFAGNLGIADGSVQMVNNSGLSNLVNQATNRLAIP